MRLTRFAGPPGTFLGRTTGAHPAEVDQCIFWLGGLAGYLQNSEEAEARRCQKTLTRLDFVVFEGGKSAGGLPARASTPAGTGPARPAAAPPTAVRPDWASISPEFSAVFRSFFSAFGRQGGPVVEPAASG